MSAVPQTSVTPACSVTLLCVRGEKRLVVTASRRLIDDSRQLTAGEMEDFRVAVSEIAGERYDVMSQGSTEYHLSGDDLAKMTEVNLWETFTHLPDMFVVTEVEVC